MIVAVIPAKRHSSRLEDKNLLEINGASLVAHAVRYAKRFRSIERIVVSTDSEEIAGIGRRCGADVHFRGEELAGEAPLIEVYRAVADALGGEEISFVVGIQQIGRASCRERV